MDLWQGELSMPWYKNPSHNMPMYDFFMLNENNLRAFWILYTQNIDYVAWN